VLQIIDAKADFVALHGVPNTAILLMRGMEQYGLKTPVFGVTNFGIPQIYTALGQNAGANFYFVSCFTPAGADESPGVVEMGTWGDKFGRGTIKDDVNYAAGWAIGKLVAEVISTVGAQPTREKLVGSMKDGFRLDTQGLSSPFIYTKDDHRGPVLLKAFNYDYETKKFKPFGSFSDYEKYVR
jgi:branched-chain amino acid transport system substrate-binding protein